MEDYVERLSAHDKKQLKLYIRMSGKSLDDIISESLHDTLFHVECDTEGGYPKIGQYTPMSDEKGDKIPCYILRAPKRMGQEYYTILFHLSDHVYVYDVPRAYITNIRDTTEFAEDVL